MALLNEYSLKVVQNSFFLHEVTGFTLTGTSSEKTPDWSTVGGIRTTRMGYGANPVRDTKQERSWCIHSEPALDNSVMDIGGCTERLCPPHRPPVKMAACSTAHTTAVTHDGRCNGGSLQRAYTCKAASR